ncbi:MAG: carbon-nitrogen hydrolase family protein, partial [Planctomycetota bacterium]
MRCARRPRDRGDRGRHAHGRLGRAHGARGPLSPLPAGAGDGPRLRVAAAAIDPALGDAGANLRAASDAVRVAAEAGADVVLLPEMWPTSFVPDADDACLAASASAVEGLARVADELAVTVVGSAYGPRAPLPTNRAHVLCGGAALAHYDKVHL